MPGKAAAFLCVLCALLFPFTVHAQTGSVSGRITDPYGRPIAGMPVFASDAPCAAGTWSGVSGADGRYRVDNIPTGGSAVSVYVYTDNDSLKFADAWWDGGEGSADCGDALEVAVSDGADTVEVDFVLTWMPGTLKWKFAVESQVMNGAPAIGPGGTVYFVAGSIVYAFDPALTGDRPKWTFEMPFASYGASPTIGPDGTIYVTNSSILTAIYPDGSERWTFQYEFGSSADGVAIGADGTIYASAANSLYAISPDGHERWRYPTEYDSRWSAPAIDRDGTIYVAAYRYLHAVRPDGSAKWVLETERSLRSTPALAEDRTIYIGSDNGLYAVNPNGTLKWYRGDMGNLHVGPTVGPDGTIYVSQRAFNPDGSDKWSHLVGDMGGSPATVGSDGNIYVGSIGVNQPKGVYAINPDGSTRWDFEPAFAVSSAPAIGADGSVYLADYPYLTALNTATIYAIHSEAAGAAEGPWPSYLHDFRHTGRFSSPEETPVRLEEATASAIEIPPWQFRRFAFAAQAGRALLVEVVPGPGVRNLVVDAQLDAPPRYAGYADFSTRTPTPRGGYELVIEPTRTGTYYFSVYGQDVDEPAGSFTITARYLDQLYLSDVSARHGANLGSVTLAARGLGFDDDTTLALTRSGATVSAAAATFVSATKLFATFDLNGLAAGTYDIRAQKPGDPASELADAFEVSEGGRPGHLKVSLRVLPLVRPAREYICWLDYENDGDADLRAPLFIISNNVGAKMRLSGGSPRRQGPIQVLGVNFDGQAGRLPPGYANSIPIYFVVPRGTPGHTDVTMKIETLPPAETPIDWNALEAGLRPKAIEDGAWQIVLNNLKSRLGLSWEDYLAALGRTAGYFSTYQNAARTSLVGDEFSAVPFRLIGMYDTDELLKFEFGQAEGQLCPKAVLAAAQDAFSPAPGLSLRFERFAPHPIGSRFRIGPLGRGWVHRYEWKAAEEANGDLIFSGPGGTKRIFYLLEDGSYQGVSGDTAQVSRIDGNFVLQERSGVTHTFAADGKLTSIADTNGNRLSFSYSDGNLIAIRHANGDQIILDYNASGRIVSVQDPAGGTVHYRYDSSNEQLVEVEMPGGAITAYSYFSDDGLPSARALENIVFPGGTGYRFAYDDRGRLKQESLLDGQAVWTYAYEDPGSVRVTDPGGGMVTGRFGPFGQLMQMGDALGNIYMSAYDGDNRMAQMFRPGGAVLAMAYDEDGNPRGMKNAANQATQLTHQAYPARIRQLTDANRRTSRFDYDLRANLTKALYPDGSEESFTYDSLGNQISFTNRRGDTVSLEYNSRGQLSRKSYPGGREVSFEYDGHGNMTRATDSETGAIVMQYDSRNFLTRIDYPNQTWFSFAYGDDGRRTRRTGHDGFVLDYKYDAAGRLDRLLDGAGALIVRYEYDQGGHLKREIRGNDTQTVYAYDKAGQIIEQINYGPGGAVWSHFIYDYDEAGNRISMTTADGRTTYRYDATGQLTAITTADGSSIEYEYDPVGNLIHLADNGQTTDYVVNSVNEIAEAGNVSFTYDADGNMLTRSDANGQTAFEYDVENRLIRVASPSGETWRYGYDALGNRMMADHDGVRQAFSHDPLGYVDVAAQYDETGTLEARYIYGLGLVSRCGPAGDCHYYTFDGTGHTTEVSDAAGGVENHYQYSPFGETVERQEAVANPFRYGGRVGVMTEENGLLFMRARYYSPELRRFVSPDPIGFAGGINQYAYADNDPVGGIDPLGMKASKFWPSKVSWQPDGTIEASWDLKKGNLTCRVNGTPGRFSAAVGVGYDTGFGKTSFNLSLRPTWPEGHRFDPLSMFQARWDNYLTTSYELKKFEITAQTPFNQETFFRRFYGIHGVGDTPGETVTIIYDDKELLNFTVFTNITPGDPNEKTGPPGVGEPHYVVAGDTLEYTVYFENKPTASAPAQEVFIDDYLDADLDWSSFALGEVGFGDVVVDAFQGKPVGRERVFLKDLAVDLEGRFYPDTGRIRWTFRSLDPQTGELPIDPLAGFLPPEDDTGRGQGYVTFRVRTRENLAAGTLITNKAAIVFDSEAPMETNEVLNTITSDAPGPPPAPLLTDGAQGVSVSVVLGWEPSEFATSYDIYVWKDGESKPAVPTVTGLVSPFYIPSGLEYDTGYCWQVVPRNVMGSAEGPVWRFTTGSRPVYPPSVATNAADPLGTTRATLKAAVNPQGLSTFYQFQYGRTAAYGAMTPLKNLNAGYDPEEVAEILTGLAPDTAYHYRVSAMNSEDLRYGADRVFTTLPVTTGIVYVERKGICGGNDPCFQWIEDGIGQALTGSAVRIAGGTYTETVQVDRDITLEIGWDADFSGTGDPDPVVLSEP